MTHGATEVSFTNADRIQVTKCPEAVARARFENIVLAVCRIAGIPVVDGVGQRFSYFWRDCPSRPWKFPYRRKHDHATVTIRDYARHSHRNSNRAAWEQFAREIGAVVIDDFSKTPIPLQERWDLYQCRMNYFVDNGPAVLCYYSDAPYVSMKFRMTRHLEEMGWHEGYQFPWANENQRLVWLEDTYENIKAAADKNAGI